MRTARKTKTPLRKAKERTRASIQRFLGSDSPETLRQDFPLVGRQYGIKAMGLARVPVPWTPPYFLMPVELFEAWKASLKTKQMQTLERWRQDLQRRWQDLSLGGWPKVIIRSSACDEDLSQRGRNISVVVGAEFDWNELSRAINKIFSHYGKRRRAGAIGLIAHARPDADIHGHLSNEVRMSPTRNQWKYELEDHSYAPRQGLNSKFAKALNARLPIICLSERNIPSQLRRVGYWCNKQTSRRSHIEWVVSERKLWVVQNDEEA